MEKTHNPNNHAVVAHSPDFTKMLPKFSKRHSQSLASARIRRGGATGDDRSTACRYDYSS